jgi:hypothetical protein
MSDASGLVSGDAGMSDQSATWVPGDTAARVSYATGILSGDGVMSVARLSDEGGLSNLIAAVLSGGDAGRPLWGWAR